MAEELASGLSAKGLPMSVEDAADFLRQRITAHARQLGVSEGHYLTAYWRPDTAASIIANTRGEP